MKWGLKIEEEFSGKEGDSGQRLVLLPTIKSKNILSGSSGPGYRFWMGNEGVVGGVAGVRWRTKGKTRWSYTVLNP